MAVDAEYYEQEQLWGNHSLMSTNREEVRIREIESLLPSDVRTVLDVGAGDGRLCNYLQAKDGANRKFVALDRSEAALRHVAVEHILASCDDIPFKNRTFDIALCCEVLEHLPFRIYEDTLRELERVADQYILITVPNNEKRERSSIQCPYCDCTFSRNRHLRSFNFAKLRALLPAFEPLVVKTIGPYVRRYPEWVFDLSERVGVYQRRNYGYPMCPQCGFDEFYPPEKRTKAQVIPSSVSAPAFIRYGRVLVPKETKQPWLLALYRRSSKGPGV